MINQRHETVVETPPHLPLASAPAPLVFARSALQRASHHSRLQFNAARLVMRRRAGRSLRPAFERMEATTSASEASPPPLPPLHTLHPHPKPVKWYNASTDVAPRNAHVWRGRPDLYPSSMVCVITLSPFRDPVLAVDGHSYERLAIERWLRSSQVSPYTGLPMNKVLFPNHTLRLAVDEYSDALRDRTAPPPRRPSPPPPLPSRLL